MSSAIPEKDFKWVEAQDFPSGLRSDPINFWTLQKLIRIAKYIKPYTEIVLKNFPESYYIDLFAGIGLHRLKGTNRLVWGSAAIAMKSNIKFTKYLLCDKNAKCIKNLKPIADFFNIEAEYYPGDCNEVISSILKKVPKKLPCFCVVDPWGLEFKWKTLHFLSNWEHIELFITFHCPGAVRNLQHNPVLLDSVLGPNSPKFRDTVSQRNLKGAELRRELCNFYKSEIRALGYEHVKGPLMVSNAQGSPIYYLIFAGKVGLGAKIMGDIMKKEVSTQPTLPGF